VTVNPLLAYLHRVLVADDEAPRALPRAEPPSSAVFLILRRMRTPLVVLIAIYAVSVLGLTLVPGRDGDGNPWSMGFFHAFYFMSYTATTIGFGEIPYAFTDAQRLWVTFSIYLTVIGWAYAIGTLLALAQDRAFRHTLAMQRFARRVRRLREPFVLVAGYGQTGRMLGRSLDALGRRFVVVDIDATRIDDLELDAFRADVPGLVADARNPEHLVLAGLGHKRLEGVIALTNDDEANLAVAMAAAMLRPDVPVLARTVSRPIAERMRAFGSPSIVNPFDRFGDLLRVALRAPAAFRLVEWLTGEPGTELPPRREPPRGRWVICGYGRFGREVVADLLAEGLDVTIIEPGLAAADDPSIIVGFGTEPDVLARARLEDAAGFVAATDNDTTNLSVIAAARRANPDIFVIARHNDAANARLFAASGADYVLVPTELAAHEVLARITDSLAARFIETIPRHGDARAAALVARLAERCGPRVPLLWRVRITADDAPALSAWLARERRPVTLGELLRDPAAPDEPIRAVALAVVRDGRTHRAPTDDFVLAERDELLLAGRRSARHALATTLNVAEARDHLLLGAHSPVGWLWRRLAGRGGEERGRATAGSAPAGDR
jgi:Trk K+ transport system NAD-binding subunit